MTTDHYILVPIVGPADARDWCPVCGQSNTYDDQEICPTCRPRWDDIYCQSCKEEVDLWGIGDDAPIWNEDGDVVHITCVFTPDEIEQWEKEGVI